MNRYSLYISIALFLLLLTNITSADVLVNDIEPRGFVNQNTQFNNILMPTGDGVAGDFELLICGVATDSGTSFNPPSGSGWILLDDSRCGVAMSGNCAQGIWWRFADSADSEDINCSWVQGSNVFAGGAFRFGDVDPVDPIIAFSCQNSQGVGSSVQAVAPSVNTEAGSQVARIYTYRNFDFIPSSVSAFRTPTQGNYQVIATTTFINVTGVGQTNLFPADGPTGDFPLDAGLDAEWTACTLALRMIPPARNVPTLSEWGLIGLALLIGSAGIFYLRSRKVIVKI